MMMQATRVEAGRAGKPDLLRQIVGAISEGAAGDGELLERFVKQQDEAAFASLLKRHGPMVIGVCRRVLGHEADSEDAFQATFLVLLRRADAVRPRSSVGDWLHGVAYRTALKARTMNKRWRDKQTRSVTRPRTGQASAAEASAAAEWQPILDEELARLPEKYREAIVLCELEGKSLKTAAAQLRVPQGTLASRLSRGRGLLAKGLKRRGAVVPASLLTIGVGSAAGAVRPALLAATLRSALAFSARAAVSSAISAPVLALTQAMLRAMLVQKLKCIAGVFLVAGLLAVACQVVAGASADGQPAEQPGAVLAVTNTDDEPPKKDEKPDEKPKAAREQVYLDGLDDVFCRSLSQLVKEERRLKKVETSLELIREVQKVFPKDAHLAALMKELEKEKDGQGACSAAVAELLWDFSQRYGFAPSSLDLSGPMPKETRERFEERHRTLAGWNQRFKGKEFKQLSDDAAAELERALERINEHRQRAGLKPLVKNETSASMARRHAVYLDLNRDRAAPGFTLAGDQGVDQQVAGRLGQSFNGALLCQSSITGVGTPVEVVDQWLASFAARCALLRPDLKGLGLAQAVSVPARADGGPGRLVVAYYTDVPTAVPDERITVVVPETGTKDVPPRLVDQRPSLLGGKKQAEAGYPVTATFWGADRIRAATGSLFLQTGKDWEEVPVHVFSPEKPALPDVWVSNLASICVIAKTPLKAKSTYRAELAAEINGKPWKKTVTFHTGAGGAAEATALRYAPGPSNNLNNAFRYRAEMLLDSPAAFAIQRDDKYLAALDLAFYRAVLWQARWEQTHGDPAPWRPLLQLAKDWSPNRDEIAKLLTKVEEGKEPLPLLALQIIAHNAVRYQELAKSDAEPAIVKKAAARLESLLAFYREHDGKDFAELETKISALRGLDLLNAYRKRLKLAEVTLDDRLSRACRQHAIYMDLNRGEGKASWTFWGEPTPHQAKKGLPGYSEAGAFAGMTSVIAFDTPESCVNGWMSSFFHRIPLLNPDARKIGIGYTLSADAFAKGTGKIALLSVPAITQKSKDQSVVLYPEPGAKGILRNYGLESPNPIAKPEKKDKNGWPIAGFPVTATFFGYDKITKASARLLVKKDKDWDEVPIYISSPEAPAAYFADNLKTICVMAKDWLEPNTTYKVAFRADLDGKAWQGETTFETGDAKALVGE